MFGAMPGSRFAIRAASSECACLLSNWSAERVSALEMTSMDRSMRFMSRSEMIPLTYVTAPCTFCSMRMRRRQVSTTSFTSEQLSRRTVSMPLQSILSYFSVPVQRSPA